MSAPVTSVELMTKLRIALSPQLPGQAAKIGGAIHDSFMDFVADLDAKSGVTVEEIVNAGKVLVISKVPHLDITITDAFNVCIAMYRLDIPSMTWTKHHG